MSENLKHLNDENFQEEIKEGITLVDFYADWCGPCRMMTPVLEEFAEEKNGEIAVAKLDIDSSPATTQQFGVTSVPTLILFKDGSQKTTIVGLKDKAALTELIDQALA